MSNFFREGWWQPLYSDPIPITGMTNDHLINSILWMDKGLLTRLEQAESDARYKYDFRPVTALARLRAYARKRQELVAEARRRCLPVPVGKEPPDPRHFRPDDKITDDVPIHSHHAG